MKQRVHIIPEEYLKALKELCIANNTGIIIWEKLEQLFPAIEIPDKEEVIQTSNEIYPIVKESSPSGAYYDINEQERDSFIEGVKWMRDKILKGE